MSRRHTSPYDHNVRGEQSRYKRESNQSGLTDRLLGHDAKERITSTLKALGIYKGDGGQSSSSEQSSSHLNLPLWDIAPKTVSDSVDQKPSGWYCEEKQPYRERGEGLRDHGPEFGPPLVVDESAVHGTPGYEQSGQYSDVTDDHLNMQSNDSNVANPSYGQEQSLWSGNSYPQNELPRNLDGNVNTSSEGGADLSNAWDSSQSLNSTTSSYNPSTIPNPLSSAFGQPWQQDEPAPAPFNGPFRSVNPVSTSSSTITNSKVGKQGPPAAPPQTRGLFDTAKRTSYVNPSRPNLKTLMEVTISNPAALTSQRDGTDPSGAGKRAHDKGEDGSGMKRSAESSTRAGRKNLKRVKLLPEQKKPSIMKRKRLYLPGENELKHYQNDPERLPLIRKIMKGSPGHQIEVFQLIGIKDDLRNKDWVAWKCYVCRRTTGSWQNYVSHCTSNYHRSLVHKLGTNASDREIVRQQLLALPTAKECPTDDTIPLIEVSDDEDESSGRQSDIHTCKACGRFYSKADDLQRHLETEQHKQRVQFLKERFGESWEQFQWYNQASQSQSRNAEEPVGVAFVVPISGFFCKLCSQFYNSEVSAKDVHCRQSSHIRKVKDWDRTSKGSMVTLSVDANEIAAAVKKNDGASSPPRSKSSNRRESPSSSRQGVRTISIREKQQDGKHDGERKSRSRSKSWERRSEKIPGLDLADNKNIAGELSDVSEDDEPLSNSKSSSSRPRAREKSKDKSVKDHSSMEEGELSASEVRQLEKNQEEARIAEEWEKREKERQWHQEQDYLSKKREQERMQEREKKEKERKEWERKEREERERKERAERERKERERREAARKERERLEREKLAKEKQEREEKERKEKMERERREKEERERKEKEEKERKEKEEREKKERERIEREKKEKEEKERKEKERLEKLKKEKEERERQEKEKKEQQEREKVRLEQEKQIQEERKRLQEAREQLERTRRLQEQREKDFKDNQMRERALLEKRIWEQQMRERELMEQQLRQQQLLEQQEFEQAMRQQKMSGERITDHQRREQERKEQQLHEQQMREREMREAELKKHQEAEYQRLQEEQLKEQELRRREMLERTRQEEDRREEEQRRLEEQAKYLREQEIRTERLLQVNLEEQEARDRTIRERGYLEWQRREGNMRAEGLSEREIAHHREIFEREVEATVVKDAEIRAQQLGEVLHDPQREGDLREKVIQQQQMRERRDQLLQELRDKARWELDRKEMELRRQRLSDREVEGILLLERQMYEGKILEELRLRGLAEIQSWEGPIDDVNLRGTDSANSARGRSRDRAMEEEDEHLRREREWREDEARLRGLDRREGPIQGNDEDFERQRSDQAEIERRREEEEAYHLMRQEKEHMEQREQEDSQAMRGEDRGIVIHEMGGLRNVQLIEKGGRLPPGDLREELRERERDVRSSAERSQWSNSESRARSRRSNRPERLGNIRGRGRGRGWRGGVRKNR